MPPIVPLPVVVSNDLNHLNAPKPKIAKMIYRKHDDRVDYSIIDD